MVLATGPLCKAWTADVKPRRSTHRSSARFIARTLDDAIQAPFPGFIEPCNPTLRKLPPSGPAWVHEIKHDGYRVQAHFDGEPRIYTRRGNEWAARMPTIAAALKALPANNLILDGELVALDRTGKPSFYELPNELKVRVKARLVYYAFDLLYLDGFDLRRAPLAGRKRVLAELLSGDGLNLIRYTEHLEGDGATVLQHACKLRLEGIVSKRADAPYRSGTRPEWVKTKCDAWREANRDRGELFRR
jgi:bifunctional non-homologous end joining protein LigD